jgi:type I restriction enzyme S subunit
MNNWETAMLGDLVEPADTWNPAKAASDEVFDYIDLSAVDQETKLIRGAQKLVGAEAPSRARQLVAKGDVLVSTVRPNLNGVAKVPEELDGATASTGFCILRARPTVLDRSYLFHWVKSPVFVDDMVRKATGASYPAVSERIIFESRLPIPPLSEQRRIAEVLDRAEALRAKRRATLFQVGTLTRSIFLNLLREAGQSVATVSIEDGMEAIIDYRGKSPTKTAVGVPLVTARVVKGGELLEPNEFIAEEDYNAWMRRGIPKPGDVLFTTEAPLGEVAQLDGRKVALAQRLLVLRGKPSLFNSTFLKHALTAQQVKKQIDARATGSTVRGIRQRELRKVMIPVPPLPVQHDFARRVAAVEKLKAAHRISLTELNALFAMLQDRAFRGEL